MNRRPLAQLHGLILVATATLVVAQQQQPPDRPPNGQPPQGGPPGFGGPGGPGGPGGRGGFGRGGGPGGPMGQKQNLVKRFDKDGDGRLNSEERKAALEELKSQPQRGRGFGRGGNSGPRSPGPKISPFDVKNYPDASLYDLATFRTFFLEFQDADWETELMRFKNTDVDVPAMMTVDGKKYPEVGVRFRGASSFFTVPEGQKHSINLTMNWANKDQKLYGYHTLDLLNAHEDPSFVRSVLYDQICRDYLPASKANFVRVVINGESWGVFASCEQFNKQLVKEYLGDGKGARWKTPGSPRGQATLRYLGPEIERYKGIYSIRSKDDEKSWKKLIEVCRVLNETPADQLESALAPKFNIDRALWFLALENVFISNDGYWIRTSDYDIYEDSHGRLNLMPHDSNETFQRPGGPGFGGGGNQVKGVELDPLIAINDESKPLYNKLLAVPSIRARYLAHVKTMAEEWLDWKKVGPIAHGYQAMIAKDVEADTRKLYSFTSFTNEFSEDPNTPSASELRLDIGLKNFCDQRRNYLMNYPEIKKGAPVITKASKSGSTSDLGAQMTAEVSGSEIGKVFLYYAADKEAPFKRIEMTKAGDGKFAATIPPIAKAKQTFYYIEARNTSGDGVSFYPSHAEYGASALK